MKITKAAPLSTLAKPDIDRLFDRYFGTRFNWLDTPLAETPWAPSLDFSETDKEYIVRIEAPGIAKDDFDIDLEGNVVTISGNRELTKEGHDEEMIWKEREEGKFVRSLRLPKTVVASKVAAEYLDGVLTVHLPKAEPTVKSKIVVK